MTEDDKQRFDDVIRDFGDAAPEVREATEDIALRERLDKTIKQLTEEQLGRPIVSMDTRTGKQETIGYILPLTLDDRSHLLIFNDGELVVTEPRHPESVDMSDYVNTMSPSESAFTAGGTNGADIKSRVYNGGTTWKMTLSNNTEEALPKMKGIIDKAIHTGVEKKAARDKARRESSRYLMDGLDKTVFRRHQPPEQHTPPPETSPPPPQQ